MSSKTKEESTGTEGSPKSPCLAKNDDSEWSDINTDDDQECDKIEAKNDSVAKSVDSQLKCSGHPPLRRSVRKIKRIIFSTKITSDRNKKRQAKMSGRKIKSSVMPQDVLRSVDALKSTSKRQTSAKQPKLNDQQVETVLNYLRKDPVFFNQIMEIAGEKPKSKSSAKIEPRITRKRARALMEKGGKVNWFLEKVSKTPKKVDNNDIAMLVQQDLPEDESDQEYDPLKDPEALAELSDDDSYATATPSTSAAVLEGALSPASDGLLVDQEKPCLSSQTRPPSASKVVRSLKFDQAETSSSHISPRITRSKSNLQEVTIEQLEMNYVPVDVTPDMYDVRIDDYALFLAETFCRPVENVDEVETENEPDPDFVYQETEVLKDLQDEFINNQTTRISKREVEDLMQELVEVYELQPEDSHGTSNSLQESHAHQPSQPEFQGFTQEQRLLIEQQMRQHIQLLLQIGLLSSGYDHFSDAHIHSRNMLRELESEAMLKPGSVFAQDNLSPAIHTLDEWQKLNLPSGETKKTFSKIAKFDVSKDLKDFIGSNTAFIYPRLLPTLAYSSDDQKLVTWSENEDSLIALGLERFSQEEKWEKNKFFMNVSSYLVEKGIIVNKSINQVKCRLKNKRSTARKGNAIAHFLTHEIAPRVAMQELEPYHPSYVAAPMFVSSDKLPACWQAHFSPTPTAKPSAKCSPKLFVSTQPSEPIVHFSPSKMTFTLLNMDSGNLLTSSFQSPARKPEKYRKIASKGTSPAPHPVKFANSPLKKARDCLLKKYSPLKKKRRTIAPKKKLDFPSAVTTESQSNIEPLILMPIESVEVQASQVEPVDCSVVPPNNLLNEAMQECGIGDEAFEEANDPTSRAPHAEIVPQDVIVDDQPEQEHVQLLLDHEAQEPQEADLDQADIDASASGLQLPKRKTKQHREADVTLQLLEPQSPSEAAIRHEQEALEIVMAAKETLTSDKVVTFYQHVIDSQNNPIQAFCALHSLCAGFPDLQEMLLDLLTPESAMLLGPEVYFQHSLRNQMKEFFRKLNIFYSNQPQTHNRVLKEMSTFLSQPNLTTQKLKNFASKTFKANQYLHDEFLALIPSMPCLESYLPEPEHVDLSDDEVSKCEKVDIPLTPEEENFGGDHCPCACHATSSPHHCIHCSLKFINGKVYSRVDGKVLRPVKVVYPNNDSPFTRSKTAFRRKSKRLKLSESDKQEQTGEVGVITPVQEEKTIT